MYFLGEPKELGSIMERKPLEVDTPHPDREVKGWYFENIESVVIRNPWVSLSEQERARRRRKNAVTAWFGFTWHPYVTPELTIGWKKHTFCPVVYAKNKIVSWWKGPTLT